MLSKSFLDRPRLSLHSVSHKLEHLFSNVKHVIFCDLNRLLLMLCALIVRVIVMCLWCWYMGHIDLLSSCVMWLYSILFVLIFFKVILFILIFLLLWTWWFLLLMTLMDFMMLILMVSALFLFTNMWRIELSSYFSYVFIYSYSVDLILRFCLIIRKVRRLSRWFMMMTYLALFAMIRLLLLRYYLMALRFWFLRLAMLSMMLYWWLTL